MPPGYGFEERVKVSCSESFTFSTVKDCFCDRLVHFRTRNSVEEVRFDVIPIEMPIVLVFLPGKCDCFVLCDTF